jgi:hypothetical protein
VGDKVKCIHTGFTGIAVSKTEFINGCVQYGVAPAATSKNIYQEDVCIDEQSLKVVPTKKKKAVVRKTGGASRRGPSMRGY